MKMHLSSCSRHAALISLPILLASGCGGDSDDASRQNRPPTITSTSTASVEENIVGAAYHVQASDPDGDELTYALTGGADAANLEIEGATGWLSFIDPPDYEAPADENADNDYEVVIEVSDTKGASASFSLSVSVTDQSQLSLRMTFPPAGANIAGYDSVRVAGIIEDLEDGIVEPGDATSITVGGASATQSLENPGLWAGTVTVSRPLSTLDLSAELADGGRVDQPFTVDNQAVLLSPQDQELDAENGRLIVSGNRLNTLIGIDLGTGRRDVISGYSKGSGVPLVVNDGLQLDIATGRLLMPSRTSGLTVIDPESGDVSYLNGTGTELRNPVDMVLDHDHQRALVIDAQTKALIAVDLDNGDRTIFSGEGIGTGPEFSWLRDLTLAPSRGEAFVATSNRAMVVSLSTGDRVDLAFGIATSLIYSTDADILFGADRGHVKTVDPDSGDMSVISYGPFSSYQNLSELVLSEDGSLLYALKYPAHEIISIDVATGTRAPVTTFKQGSGPYFQYLANATLDSSGKWILLVDRYARTLLRLDPKTGDREILSGTTVGSGPQLVQPLYFCLLPGREEVLVTDDGSALVRVDLESGDRTIVSDATTGTGPAFAGIRAVTVSADGTRAYVADSSYTSSAILSVDLETGDRIVVSENGTDDGPALSNLEGLILDQSNNRILTFANYPSSISTRSLLEIDLETGARAVVSGASRGTGPAVVFAQGIAPGFSDEEVLISDGEGQVLSVDLLTGNRHLISSPIKGQGVPLSLLTTGVPIPDPTDNLIYVAGPLWVIAIQPKTGDRVVVAQ